MSHPKSNTGRSTSTRDSNNNGGNSVTDNSSSVNDNDIHQRFWGVPRVLVQKPVTFTLERTELHVTQVAIAEFSTNPSNHSTASASTTVDGNNSSMLYASTKLIKDIPVCTLSSRGPRHCLVDLNFFPHDESVTFRVEGNLPLALAGTIAIFGGQLLVSDDEEDEQEEPNDDDEQTDNDDEENEEDDEDEDEDGEDIDDEEEEIPAPKPTKGNAKPLTATEKLLKRKREEQEQQQVPSKGSSSSTSRTSTSLVSDLPTISTSKGTTTVQPVSKDTNNQQQNKKRKEETVSAKGTTSNNNTNNNTGKKDIASPTVSVGSASANDNVKSLANGKIKYIDLVQGSGNIATNGQRVTVAYEGRLKNGKVFDKGNKFTFRLGKKEVIKGWDLGVAGMHLGGKRKLIIHPDLAYGSMGSPPVIPPNSTLIFDVTLLRTN